MKGDGSRDKQIAPPPDGEYAVKGSGLGWYELDEIRLR